MLYITRPHYQGARRAYFALYPNLNDTDWERWLKNIAGCKGDREGDYETLAALCRLCLSIEGERLKPEIFEHIATAEKFFENPSRIYLRRREFAEKREANI
ncbi:hypothetical protein [Parasphingorhabdus sp.]|uniref:hypothetical protein n=1 Tax=Parasphingorhabdus sp. TaxID=2709688 RepID=UPI003A948532